MNMTNATNQMGSRTNGAATGIVPNLAAPNQGLNDDWLLDDSVEQKEEQIHIPAFKESAPGEIPEENPNVDLIAASEEMERVEFDTSAALEDLNVALRDLELLRANIDTTGGMKLSIAMECNELIPGFINEDVRPMGYFTVNTSKTMLNEALEAIEGAEQGFLAKAKAKIGEYVQKLIEFFKKQAAKFVGLFKKRKENNVGVTLALINKKAETVEQDLTKAIQSSTTTSSGQQQQQKTQTPQPPQATQSAPQAESKPQLSAPTATAAPGAAPVVDTSVVKTGAEFIKNHIKLLNERTRKELPQAVMHEFQSESAGDTKQYAAIAVNAMAKWPNGEMYTIAETAIKKVTQILSSGVPEDTSEIVRVLNEAKTTLSSYGTTPLSAQGVSNYISIVEKTGQRLGLISDIAVRVQEEKVNLVTILNKASFGTNEMYQKTMELLRLVSSSFQPLDHMTVAFSNMDMALDTSFKNIRDLAVGNFNEALKESSFNDKKEIHKVFIGVIYADRSGFSVK